MKYEDVVYHTCPLSNPAQQTAKYSPVANVLASLFSGVKLSAAIRPHNQLEEQPEDSRRNKPAKVG